MFAGCTFTSTDVPLHTSATLLFDKDRSAFFECGFDRAAVQYLEVSSHVAAPCTVRNLSYRRAHVLWCFVREILCFTTVFCIEFIPFRLPPGPRSAMQPPAIQPDMRIVMHIPLQITPVTWPGTFVTCLSA